MDPHSAGGGEGRGGVLWGILGGGVVISDSARCMWNRARVRVSWLGLVGFRPKNVVFPHLFSGLASKIHTRFQTWTLGTYVIITKD